MMPMPRGVIFDLDGTLVDSGLDFDSMRREMGLDPGTPILESLATLPEQDAGKFSIDTKTKAPSGPC